jgi:hypothetical protein
MTKAPRTARPIGVGPGFADEQGSCRIRGAAPLVAASEADAKRRGTSALLMQTRSPSPMLLPLDGASVHD